MTPKILEESEEFGAHPGYILQVREQEANEYMLDTSISVSPAWLTLWARTAHSLSSTIQFSFPCISP